MFIHHVSNKLFLKKVPNFFHNLYIMYEKIISLIHNISKKIFSKKVPNFSHHFFFLNQYIMYQKKTIFKKSAKLLSSLFFKANT